MLLTTQQAAARLGCSPRLIQQAIQSGRIRAHGERYKLVDERELAKLTPAKRGRPRKGITPAAESTPAPPTLIPHHPRT